MIKVICFFEVEIDNTCNIKVECDNLLNIFKYYKYVHQLDL